MSDYVKYFLFIRIFTDHFNKLFGFHRLVDELIRVYIFLCKIEGIFPVDRGKGKYWEIGIKLG